VARTATHRLHLAHAQARTRHRTAGSAYILKRKLRARDRRRVHGASDYSWRLLEILDFRIRSWGVRREGDGKTGAHVESDVTFHQECFLTWKPRHLDCRGTAPGPPAARASRQKRQRSETLQQAVWRVRRVRSACCSDAESEDIAVHPAAAHCTKVGATDSSSKRPSRYGNDTLRPT
jgi:hypothetical protein